MTNTTGQSSTPAVRLKDKSVLPKKDKLIGFSPSQLSNEKIFTPINSASKAFAIKKEPRM